MAQEELLKRIAERLKAANLSERKALMKSGAGMDFVRDIRRRGHNPRVDKLSKLARTLETPLSYFTDAVVGEAEQGDLQPSLMLSRVNVIGAVQGGAWVEAIEWDPGEWWDVTIPADDRFPGINRFGLLVRGDSMDRLYPDGTIVIVVRFNDLGRTPEAGEKVVVLHRSEDGGEFEATIKEYQVDAQGRRLLWPRSSDPNFQTPFILPAGDLVLAEGTERLPRIARASNTEDAAGVPDLMVAGLVVGMYRRE